MTSFLEVKVSALPSTKACTPVALTAPAPVSVNKIFWVLAPVMIFTFERWRAGTPCAEQA